MNSLSLVMASAGAPPERCSRSARAMAASLLPADELILVDAVARRASVAGGNWLALTLGGDDLGWSYRAGFDLSTRPFVAFTDAWTTLSPGWRSAAAAAIARGWTLTGGPVLPVAMDDPRDQAGFVSEYACHAAAPYRGATGDAAACNVLYARDVLAAFIGPLWKSVVNRRLAERGVHVHIEPEMIVTHDRRYGAELYRDRFEAGRRYGRQRGCEIGRLDRLAHVIRAPLLPAVMLWRSWTSCVRDKDTRRLFTRSLGPLVCAHGMWSLGEAMGFAESDRFGKGFAP